LGERVNGIHEVSGSIPLGSTIFFGKPPPSGGFFMPRRGLSTASALRLVDGAIIFIFRRAALS
jgi:hypothetical protein